MEYQNCSDFLSSLESSRKECFARVEDAEYKASGGDPDEGIIHECCSAKQELLKMDRTIKEFKNYLKLKGMK